MHQEIMPTESAIVAVFSIIFILLIRQYFQPNKEQHDVRSQVLKPQTRHETYDLIEQILENSKIITEFANRIAELNDVKSRLNNAQSVQQFHDVKLRSVSEVIGELTVSLEKRLREYKNDMNVMSKELRMFKLLTLHTRGTK